MSLPPKTQRESPGNPGPGGAPTNLTTPLLLAGAALVLGLGGFWLASGGLSPPPPSPEAVAVSPDTGPAPVAPVVPVTGPATPAAAAAPAAVEAPSPTHSRSRPIDPAQHRIVATQIRERLKAARPTSEEGTAGGEPNSIPPFGPPPPLPREYIVDAIRGQFIARARDCYNVLLQENPESGGKVVVSFTVIADEEIGGVVDEVQLAEGTEMTDVAFTDCLRASMYEVLFDPPSDGGSVTVTYPLTFETD